MTDPFQPLADNAEKGDAYSIQWQRFNLACSQGFHLEAVFILYALMEDRLASLLYHAGVLDESRVHLTTTEPIRSDMKIILAISSPKEPRWYNISAKRDTINKLLTWASTYTSEEVGSEYLTTLAASLKAAARYASLPATLYDLNTWCQTRNVLVHALMRRRVVGQEEKLADFCEQGKKIFRNLDAYVASFSAKSRLRKKFNIH
jgi:hypothetical protein